MNYGGCVSEAAHVGVLFAESQGVKLDREAVESVVRNCAYAEDVAAELEKNWSSLLLP